MAYTKYTIVADGTESNNFPVSFEIPYLSKDDVQVRVNEEEAAGSPSYRTITWTTDSLVNVGGGAIVSGDQVVFTNTPDVLSPAHDFGKNAGITAAKLDANQLQVLLLAGMLLDGRFLGAFEQDIDMGQHKLVNIGDPEDPTDAVTKEYVDDLNATTLSLAELEDSAATSAAEAGNSAAAADLSATNADTSEDNALASAIDAAASAADALVSETNAAASETNVSADATTVAANTATVTAAETVVTAAEANVVSLEASTVAAAAAAAIDASDASADASAAAVSAADALVSAAEAAASAASVATPFFLEGVLDASGGVYPASPTSGGWWRISVAGTISGTAYAVNDWAAYTASGWYKFDNTEPTNVLLLSGGTVTGALTVEDYLTAEKGSPFTTRTDTAITLDADDAGSLDLLDNASSITVTIPLNATDALPIGFEWSCCQYGAGTVTIAPEGAVVLVSATGLSTREQYSPASIKKIATDTWWVIGDTE